MLNCVKPSSSRKQNVHSPLPSHQASSAEGTPRSSTQLSPTVNLTHEYTLAMQTNSYGEVWSKIYSIDHSAEHQDSIQVEDHEEPHLQAQILNPSQECVQEALQYTRPGTLTRLVSAYFEHSETTSHLCLTLLDSVHRARSLYSNLQNICDVLPLDSDSNALTHSQCDTAFDIFIEFSNLDNPFPYPESHNFHDIRHCFSHLNQQLHHRLCKSRSRVHRLSCTTTCAAICLVGTAVGVAISAVVIASHALVALVAGPLLPACLPSNINKKEVAHLAQLDAAARGTFVLHNYLDTIDRLVERLFSAVEDDKLLIRLGLAGGSDRYPIHEVAKQLKRNNQNFHAQLVDLEEHICLCIAAINRARSALLDEIHLHQSHLP